MANGWPGTAEATASPDFDMAAKGTIFQEFAHKVAEQIGQELVETLCQAAASVRHEVGPGGDAFEQSVKKVVNQMAQHLAGTLSWEHQRHIERMFSEVVRLRSELSRVAELMQGYLQRERQLQEMLDQLSKTPLNNADEATLQMAMSYREGQIAERMQWPSTAQGDKDVVEGQVYTQPQLALGAAAERGELQGAFNEASKAPLPQIMINNVQLLPQAPAAIAACASPSSSATATPADKDYGYQTRLAELPVVNGPVLVSTITGSVEGLAESLEHCLKHCLGGKETALASSSQPEAFAFSLGEPARSEVADLRTSDLVGCQSRTSQLAELLASAEASSGSTKAPGSSRAAVTLSIDDTSRSTQTVRRDLVDGFNQALCAAEFSPEPWLSAAGLRPKLAELRTLVSEAYTPKAIQRGASLRAPHPGTATPPFPAPASRSSASLRTISPAPRAVTPVQHLRDVSPLARPTPASPRPAPQLVISSMRTTPPVTSSDGHYNSMLQEMPMQSPQSMRTTPSAATPARAITAMLQEMPMQSPASGLRVPASPSTPPPTVPFPLPPRLHHGYALSAAAPPMLFPQACQGTGMSPALRGNGLQMDLGMPALRPSAGDALTASQRSLRPSPAPPADDPLMASQRFLQHRQQTPQRTPRQAAGWSPVYC